MTRKSKRELERSIDKLEPRSSDAPDRVIIRHTVVGTSWEGDDLEPGETEETVREIEL